MSPLAAAKTLVVKVGSSLVTAAGRGLDAEAIARWAAEIAPLVRSGRRVILVSSGAIAEGMLRLGWSRRPQTMHELQAAAAVGQMGLVQCYESCFRRHGLHTAQVLLTHADLADRQRYLNARATLRTLLELGVIPVINENDTVVTDEIKFGDNDTLGALVTNLVEADALVILTDQAGLFDADPRSQASARLIEEADALDARLGERRIGFDRHLPAGVADRGQPLALQRDRQEPDRDLLAGRRDHVELALHLGGDALGRELLGQAEQAVGLAAHRRRDDDHPMPGARPFGDPLGDVANPLGRPHRGAAVLVNDECHEVLVS